METKRSKIWFWIITILCILAVILSPVLMCVLKSKIPGALVFGGAIVLWIITIILHERK